MERLHPANPHLKVPRCGAPNIVTNPELVNPPNGRLRSAGCGPLDFAQGLDDAVEVELALHGGGRGGEAALGDGDRVGDEEAEEQKAEAVGQKDAEGQRGQNSADQHDCGKQDSLSIQFSIQVQHSECGGWRAVWRGKSCEFPGKLLTRAVPGSPENIGYGRQHQRTAYPSTARLLRDASLRMTIHGGEDDNSRGKHAAAAGLVFLRLGPHDAIPADEPDAH